MLTKYILIKIIMIIAIIEFLIMQLFGLVDGYFNVWQETLLDTLFLSILSAPILYKYVIYPFIEKELKSRKELIKTNEDFSNNVIASSTDLAGIITSASQALCTISGYTQSELIGQAHNILRHPDTPSIVFEDMWDTIQSGKPWHGEYKNATKDGGFYWVRASVFPTFDSGFNIIGYSSFRQDISAQKTKEEFMANMSHELRTPLNAIIGFSGLLNKKQTDKDLLPLSQHIKSSANSLLSLINDILDLSKIQDSQFTIDSYEFNAYEEISQHSKQFDGLLTQKKLVLNKILDDSLKGIFLGDWLRISQIVLNLISNALKFTPVDGTITYEVTYKESQLIITITDNGIGMNKETQDKIFKPFIQADGLTTRKYGGTGLGLSITQKLVELIGGTIELESAQGEGTTFTVKLPIQYIRKFEMSTNPEKITIENKDNTLSGHVLIVEDNKTNQMLIKMLLTDFGLTSDIANDGLEALELYNPQKHQLILMDENMPNMNGIEAMKALKGRYKDECGAIISLTANAMKGDKERFINLGMDGYLAKPIDENKLYKLLVTFL